MTSVGLSERITQIRTGWAEGMTCRGAATGWSVEQPASDIMSDAHAARRIPLFRLSSMAMFGVHTAVLALSCASLAEAQGDTLPPVTVTVTRAELSLTRLPFAVAIVDKRDFAARPTLGLDEALAGVPGVFAANRYNFSLDQRLAIRGFGSRSAFAVRGIKILLDGIPQTLPDGQGQLTHVEVGAADRIEVLRGSAAALYGNASGGVISIWTDARDPVRSTGEVRVVAGTFDRGLDRTWTKWQGTGRFRVGSGGGGGATLTLSRLSYEGARDHSAADLRALGARLRLPLGTSWSLTALADVGDQPRADNPGALNLTELGTNRDTVPPLNVATRAGKDVLQGQAGATLRGRLASGDEATVTLFGLARDLENPQTFAYIRLNRTAYGTRAVMTRRGGAVTAGIDVQRQRDDRANFGNAAGVPDTVRTLDQLEHVTEFGPFVQAVVGLAARSTFTAGLRYDRVSFDVRDRLVGDSSADVKYRNDSGRRVMAALSGSLGATLQAGDALTIYASTGSSFETPTTTELANRPDTAGGFNSGLAPQRAWTYEVGARGPSWELALYQADVRNALVGFEIPGSPGRRFFRNAGSARHRGVELTAGAAPLPGLDFRVTWTYSDFRYRHYAFTAGGGGTTHVLDGQRLPGIPRHALRLALRARPASLRKTWVELETQHASRYAVDDTLPRETSPWWVTNLRAGWDGVRVAPFVAVQNLFNRKYVGSVVVNAAAGRYYEPAPGRNVYVGLTIGSGR
jgi:iron complex outermembrane receptor protein